MSDWDDSARKRKNFRRSKDDPEIAKIGKKKKRKNKWKLVAKNCKRGFFSKKRGDYVLNKFVKKEDAEQSLKTQQIDSYWNDEKTELVIEEI